MSKDKKFHVQMGLAEEGLRSVGIEPKVRWCHTKWVQVCFGLYMSKISLRDVSGFTIISFSLVSFWTYNWKLPLRSKRRESYEEFGYNFILGVPRGYPNTTKHIFALFYPF